MHYYEDLQNREKTLTRDFVSTHLRELYSVLDLKYGDLVVVELQKHRYRKDGDVDIAVWKNPGSQNEEIIAIEVKVIFLDKDGSFKSEKLVKHNKQINALIKEGWDYVWFFDFIVNMPSQGWFHPQAFDGHDNYRKSVDAAACGHVVFQINSVAHKPESMAGSISKNELRVATKNAKQENREILLNALREMKLSSPMTIDTVSLLSG